MSDLDAVTSPPAAGYVRPTVVSVVLLVSALALTYVHARTVDVPHYEARRTLHEGIVAGTAGSPYAYRLLVPLITEPIVRLLSIPLSDKAAFWIAYIGVTFASIWVLLLASARLFAIWYPLSFSLTGALLLAVLIPVTFFDQQFQPWSLPEGALVSMAIWAAVGRRWGLLMILTVIACLNRETGLVVPVIAWTVAPQSAVTASEGAAAWLNRCRGPLLCVLGLGVILTTRLIVGPREHVIEPRQLLHLNLSVEWMLRSALTWVVLVGGLGYLASRGYASSPRVLRRAVWLVPAYAMSFLAFGVWYEVRLLIPLLPILVGFALGTSKAESTESRR